MGFPRPLTETTVGLLILTMNYPDRPKYILKTQFSEGCFFCLMPFKSVNQVTFDELTDARDREFRHNGYTNYSMANFLFSDSHGSVDFIGHCDSNNLSIVNWSNRLFQNTSVD